MGEHSALKMNNARVINMIASWFQSEIFFQKIQTLKIWNNGLCVLTKRIKESLWC